MKTTYVKPPSDEILLTTSLELNTGLKYSNSSYDIYFLRFEEAQISWHTIDCLILSLSNVDNLAPNVYMLLEISVLLMITSIFIVG